VSYSLYFHHDGRKRAAAGRKVAWLREGEEAEMLKRWMMALAAGFGILAALIGAAWTPDRSVESLQARWAPAPSGFVTVGGVSVHLRDEGPRNDPHPIVLIHGTASSLHTWEGWVPALKERRRVVSFDLPGSGLSGEFPDDDYRIERYTRFMGDFLDRLGIERATLVGNSRGGRIAWATAVARPGLVDRLVLIDSRGYPGETASVPVAFQLARVPVFRSLIEHITPRSFIEKNITEAYGDPQKVTPDLVDRYYELFLHAGNRRALTFQFEQETDTGSDRIKSISIPTLIMWGKLDRRIPVRDARRFHQDIAGSRLVVFDRLGHMPQEEDPARTVRALEDFLAR
jgi:pimeloyl-ACP methyl ester carboxylesterase